MKATGVAVPFRQSAMAVFIQINNPLLVYQICPLCKHDYVQSAMQNFFLNKFTELWKRKGLRNKNSKVVHKPPQPQFSHILPNALTPEAPHIPVFLKERRNKTTHEETEGTDIQGSEKEADVC